MNIYIYEYIYICEYIYLQLYTHRCIYSFSVKSMDTYVPEIKNHSSRISLNTCCCFLCGLRKIIYNKASSHPSFGISQVEYLVIESSVDHRSQAQLI